MLTIAPLLILTVEVVLGQGNSVAVKEQIYSLDMANKSVDDKYEGCRKNMSDLVFTTLLKNEIDENPTFKSAWEEGEKKAMTPEDNLTMNHSIAIYMYTGRKVYGFNNAGRSGKHNYKRRLYRWYSLQFLLTEAIQILNKTQKQCHLTYRRTKVEFDKDVKNKEVRFGSFASSTLGEKPKTIFGNVSCFEIETCEGADVANYSAIPREKEVLIPPYEKFIVTDIKNNTWCDTVYVLKSLGTKSDLNCNLASVKQTNHRFISHNRGVGTHRLDPKGFGPRGFGTHAAGPPPDDPKGLGPPPVDPKGFGPHVFCPREVGTHAAGPDGDVGPLGPDGLHGPRAQY